MAVRTFALALALLAAARLPFVAVEDDTPEHRLATLARAFVDEEDVAGLSLVVAVGPDVLFEAGFGYADPSEALAAAPDSPYRAGALTSTFVAALLLDLVEEGALDLDDPVTKHLEGLELGDGDVTLGHLLAHTSGLPGYAVAFGDTERPFDADAVLAWLTGEPRLAAPGTCFAYSETDDLLAGLVLERVTERSVRQLIETRLLDAFGMRASEYSWEGPAVHEHEDVSHEFRGELVTLGSFTPPFEANGFLTTARDLVRFQRGLVDELLEPTTLAQALRPHRLDDASETGYGLGLSLRELDGREAASFGGGLAGGRVHVAWYPETDLTVAVLAHGSDVALEPLERSLSRIVLDVPEAELLDLPLDEDEAGRYVGEYVAGCLHIAVEHDGEHLRLVPAVGPARVLLRQAEHVFAARDEPEVRVTFVLEDDLVRALILDDHGATIEARRQ